MASVSELKQEARKLVSEEAASGLNALLAAASSAQKTSQQLRARGDDRGAFVAGVRWALLMSEVHAESRETNMKDHPSYSLYLELKQTFHDFAAELRALEASLKDVDSGKSPSSSPQRFSVHDRINALREAGLSGANARPHSRPLPSPPPTSSATASNPASEISDGRISPQSPRTLNPPDSDDRQDSPSTISRTFPSLDQFEHSFPDPPSLPILPSVPVSDPSAASNSNFNDVDRRPSPPSFNVSSSASTPSSRPPLPRPPSPGPSNSHEASSDVRLSNGTRSPSGLKRSPKIPTFNLPNGPTAQPPSPRTSPAPPSVPVHSHRGSIEPHELYSLFKAQQSVLLLDLRPRERYQHGHISIADNDIVNVDPVILRNEVDSQRIQNSLVLTSKEEQSAFANRNKYAFIIIYDESSTSTPGFVPKESSNSSTLPDSDAEVSLNHLFKAIYTREFIKPLQKPPLLLSGGWRKWQQDIGAKGIDGFIDENLEKSPSSYALPSPRNNRSSYSAPLSLTTNGSDLEKIQASGEAARRLRGKQSSSREPTLTDTISKGAMQQSNGDGHPPYQPKLQHDPISNYSSTTSTVSAASSSSTLFHPAIPKPEIAAQKLTSPDYRSYPQTPSSSYFPGPEFQQSSKPAYSSGADAYPNAPMTASASSNGYRRGDSYLHKPMSPSGRPSTDYPRLPPHSVEGPTRPPQAAQHHNLGLRTRGMSLNTHSTDRPPDSGVYSPTTSPSSQKAFSTFLAWGDGSIGRTGLKNLGNTCYMNSTLQCLSATVPLARFFNDGSFKRDINTVNTMGTRGVLAEAVSTLFQNLWSERYNFVAPMTFRDAICHFAAQFRGHEQHDSQEFLAFLLDGLHEDFNRIRKKPPPTPMTKQREEELETIPEHISSAKEWSIYLRRENSIILQLFQGQYRSRLQCLTCHKSSTTYNPFMYLSLPVPNSRSVTLDACVQAYLRVEILDGDDAWHCPQCKKPRKASKQLSLSRLPPILLIHLKRFHFRGPFSDKIDSAVQFPLSGWNLSNYVPSPSLNDSEHEIDGQGNGVGKDDILQKYRGPSAPPVYDLYAVSDHYGNLSSGHYTAFAKSRDQWFNFDDSRVSLASAQDVSRDKNAYILFYRQAL